MSASKYVAHLFSLMEQKLSADDLESVIMFINAQPYKQEARQPTLAEQEVVIAHIENVLLTAKPDDLDDDSYGLRRMMESGDIDNLPDTDF